MADGLGWFGAFRPNGPTLSGLMLNAYFHPIFLHHLKKCGQCLVLDGLVPCFPDLMVLLIVWLNVLNG
jgi:hypothetical protein